MGALVAIIKALPNALFPNLNKAVISHNLVSIVVVVFPISLW